MSRGFWSAIGGIVGFFLGGILGHAAGTARSHSLDDGGWGAIGDIAGLVIGVAVTWLAIGLARSRR
jgi:outer membrane lipoprotein SlyB